MQGSIVCDMIEKMEKGRPGGKMYIGKKNKIKIASQLIL